MSEEPAGGDLSRLRQLNAAAVLRELRGDQPLTLTELSKRTRSRLCGTPSSSSIRCTTMLAVPGE